MWRELVGTWTYQSGTSGSVVVPSSAIVVRIMAHASAGGAYVTVFGGSQIPIVNGAPPTDLFFNHDLVQAHSNGASATIVFSGTDAYLVEQVSPPGGS
jgi:hypothetical protein